MSSLNEGRAERGGGAPSAMEAFPPSEFKAGGMAEAGGADLTREEQYEMPGHAVSGDWGRTAVAGWAHCMMLCAGSAL